MAATETYDTQFRFCHLSRFKTVTQNDRRLNLLLSNESALSIGFHALILIVLAFAGIASFVTE
jgi:hypothetical protein